MLYQLSAPNDIRNQLDENLIGMSDVKEYILKKSIIAGKKNDCFPFAILLCRPEGTGKSHAIKILNKVLDKPCVPISIDELNDCKEDISISLENKIKTMGMLEDINKGFTLLIEDVDKLDNIKDKNIIKFITRIVDREHRGNLKNINLDRILVIATARNVNDIPREITTRFELFTGNAYTVKEKIDISRKILIPQIIARYPECKAIVLTDETLNNIIIGYTKEPGVHNLKRILIKLYENIYIKMIYQEKIEDKVDITDYLGPQLYTPLHKLNTLKPGYATGLAWTYDGGMGLIIEIENVRGNGNYSITANIGKAMQQSIVVALECLKVNYERLEIDYKALYQQDFYIHISEMSISKDGPSAGLAVAIALLSKLKNVAIKQDIAITGEISLSGEVMRVGGLYEKFNAALNMGIKEIILPMASQLEYNKLSEELKESIKPIFVKDIFEASRYLL